jgi:predicted restriction endonuclease
VPTGRSKNLGWLSSADLTSVKNLLDNPALWASYERASRLALDSPDGRPRKDSFYKKHGKVRLSDLLGYGNPLQELESEEPEIRVLSRTEAEAVRLSRIGQGRFRDSLLACWFNKCSVTGSKATRVLRASHLKPWKDSTNAERLDPYNGLLLIPNLDAALDVGLITFDDDGKIRLSSQLCSEDAASLGVLSTMKISPVGKRHLKYLRYHRQNKFIE